LLLTLLAVTTYFYFQNSKSPAPRAPAQATANAVTAQPAILVASVTPASYHLRWKTGPNAQTDFEPFLPSEQLTWNNHTSSYTIVGGAARRR
jgi:hypothetical protein